MIVGFICIIIIIIIISLIIQSIRAASYMHEILPQNLHFFIIYSHN